MAVIQFLKDTIQDLTNLERENNDKIKNILDRVYRKLIMIVERKFGRERDYINQLETLQKMQIGPLAAIIGTSQSDIYKRVRKDLIRKRDGYLNLIETILDELKLDKTANHPEIMSLDTKEDLFVKEENINRRAIFVVHGRNELIRKSIFDFLRSINLEPIEWEEAIKMTGKTNPYIGEILETAFSKAQAILVIFTPDDLVKLNPRFHKEDDPNYEKELTGQARPNVLFEAGIGIGKNPDRTILVQIGNVKPFSDIAGRYMIKFKGTAQDRRKLTNRLESAGCDVNLNGTDWLTTGDFTFQEIENSDFKEEQISKDIIEIKKNRVQELFDEFTNLIIRLYKSKASTSNIFAQKIHNSLEMQEYFGITAKRPTQPGHSLDDEPIYFLYKLFKIIPNSAHFDFDPDRTGNYGNLLKKDSAPDTIKDILIRFFKHLIKFVKKEFHIELEFKGNISI